MLFVTHKSPISKLSFRFNTRSRIRYSPRCACREMTRRRADFRLHNISGYKTDLLTIQANDPSLHVIFIPGNPGIISFYADFLESLHESLGGHVSVTAIGHISHTSKNWENGRLFSLQEQIDHKMDFIRQELRNSETPLVLVGHSIGSYIAIELFRRFQEKVVYCVGLYPFLTLNRQSRKQSIIGKIAASSNLSAVISFLVALLGLLPSWASRLIVRKSLGKSWSVTATEACCSHLVKYHTVRNVLFLAMTEFKKLTESPDWAFMRRESGKFAFLYGLDDHWGPLQMFEEISERVPDITISIEREGFDHAFSCTVDGSIWVAQHVANLIKNKVT